MSNIAKIMGSSPRAACNAIAARKRSVALISLCSFCSPVLRDPPFTYSITDARLPCAPRILRFLQLESCHMIPCTKQDKFGQLSA